MSKFVVVKINKAQFKVSEGDEVLVDKMEGEKGKTLEFSETLLFVDDKKIEIGQPLVKNIKIKAKIIDQLRGEKVRVATFEAKTGYRRAMGFRPELTKIQIEKITPGD